MATALQGAFLLARGRPDGLLLIAAPPETEMAVAARSFWAMAVCLPAFLCLHLLDGANDGPAAESPAGLALDLLGYVIGWVGFALLSHRLAGTMGRDALWPRFITVWNWCNVVQYVMLLGAGLISLLDLPELLAQTIWLVAAGWALWLEWYATRLALAIPAGPAAALVGLDFALGLFLAGLTGTAG
jgi:hypothetical protein